MNPQCRVEDSTDRSVEIELSGQLEVLMDVAGAFTGFDVAVGDDGVTTVTLARPERKNGFTLSMKRELTDWLVHATAAEAVRVIVFAARGDDFSAGDDISGKGDETRPPTLSSPLELGQRCSTRTYNALRLASQPLAAMMRKLDKPTVAAVQGYAIQSGLTLALGCDFRIAAEGAKLGSGTLRFALTPDDGGLFLLVQHLGLAQATDFVMRNRIITAERALELGLVNEVVPRDRLLPAALELARELAAMPQVALRMVKRSLQVASESTFERSLEDIAIRTAITDYHDDAEEGIAAFREKRPARYNAWLERS